MDDPFSLFSRMFSNYPNLQKSLSLSDTLPNSSLGPPSRSATVPNVTRWPLSRHPSSQQSTSQAPSAVRHSNHREENRRPRPSENNTDQNIPVTNGQKSYSSGNAIFSPNSAVMSDEERKRNDWRFRERRDNTTTNQPREHREPRLRKPNGFDLIDKLDVTGLYGSGLFHHDGPFDACNPHRNRKGSSKAPMHAFPANSANNSLGGSGPINSSINMDQFNGTGAEGWTDFGNSAGAYSSTNAISDSPSREFDPSKGIALEINPHDRVQRIHGIETFGLGTSTFLEGTPASRTAIQRRETDERIAAEIQTSSGLQRKKSLAQRIRGMSQVRGVRPIFDSETTRLHSDVSRISSNPESANSPSAVNTPTSPPKSATSISRKVFSDPVSVSVSSQSSSAVGPGTGTGGGASESVSANASSSLNGNSGPGGNPAGTAIAETLTNSEKRMTTMSDILLPSSPLNTSGVNGTSGMSQSSSSSVGFNSSGVRNIITDDSVRTTKVSADSTSPPSATSSSLGKAIKSPSAGFLSRVKSLRGGKKRMESRTS